MAPARKHSIEVRHNGLHRYRVISGTDRYVVGQEARAQMAAWDQMWERRLAKEASIANREAAQKEREKKKKTAFQRTQEAQNAIKSIKTTLQRALGTSDVIDWDLFRNHSTFEKPDPVKKAVHQPQMAQLPAEPDPSDALDQANLPFLYEIMSSRLARKIEEAKAVLESVRRECEKRKQDIVLLYKRTKQQYKVALRDKEEHYNEESALWEQERQDLLSVPNQKNHVIDKHTEEYLKGSADAIINYCDSVLTGSEYPDSFPHEFEIDYNNDTKTLVVDYLLPSPEVLPRVKEVKYVQSRDEFEEVNLSEAETTKLYDSLLYQMTIRTIHELYEADVANALDAIVFNGWIALVDKGTGQEKTACTLSVHARKAEFRSMNLSLVEPKQCFKTLKGVGGTKLHGLSPVAPLLQLSREGKRFASSHVVTHTLDCLSNIAAMDWEGFEHLVHELFQKEFMQNGGQVRITQASRDGGVDAIVFDPDPIRGGRIVIQAKRYTNVVGVSAVRDLYGTVINEGAIKGILITTSEYGLDAYEFAKGKPLALLTGTNLLHLLQKHGYNARIDLKEAKQILSEKRASSATGQRASSQPSSVLRQTFRLLS